MRVVQKVEFTEFEWDENKRLSNIRKSGLDFYDAVPALLLPHLEMPSPRNGEARIEAICKSSDRVIIVIYTMRGSVCRIISAWPADKNEQRTYREIFGG